MISCHSRPVPLAIACLIACLLTKSAVAQSSSIVLWRADEPGVRERFEVRTDPVAAERIAASEVDTYGELFPVYVDDGGERAPLNLFGDYELSDTGLIFYPRYPLRPSLTYVASLRLGDDREPIVAKFTIPKKRHHRITEIAGVHPSTDVLPENQLKFYLHFSQPMSRGEAYVRVHLFKTGTGEIAYPFLELGEELWDPGRRRFTLFFDPGRVKRGLKPREEVGPALEESGTYRLVIDQDWKDANGQSLRMSFIKSFRVGPPDYDQPDPTAWRIEPPRSATREPLVVVLDESLDHGMLNRVITVMGEGDQLVTGAIEVSDNETRWSFRPDSSWVARSYELVVQTNIEDLAGNSIACPFEVDLFRSVETRVKRDFVRLPFEVK
jgi:hypothetical protein